MAKGNRKSAKGFSLVELLIAVVFIGFLMAGMANVFRSSVTTLSTSSEGISSARRNRMSMDLLYDDLNSAGMFLTDLSSPPLLSTNNPAFYVLPNMAVTGAAADDPQTADQLLFYLDQPLPFEGVLKGTGGGAGAYTARSASDLVMAGAAPNVADNTYTVDCKDPSYAPLLKAGHFVVIKDSWETLNIVGTPTVSGSPAQFVTFTVGASSLAPMSGVGPSGAPSKVQHLGDSTVLFFQPAQMVRYSVQMMLFDPQKVTGIPCLVRDQGTYGAGGFVPVPGLQSIVAENVSGFKVYLSANAGQSWAGLGKTYSGFTSGWSNGMRADLDTQLAVSGRPDFKTTQGNENWIRDIPTLVRLDVTTRTTIKRAETVDVRKYAPYTAIPLPPTDYKDYTQSLVIVPRHFGLTMN